MANIKYEIIITEDQVKEYLRSVSRKYAPNFTLKYPEKVSLPLDGFCEFYFKSNGIPLTFRKRVNRAYNDAITYGLMHLKLNPTTGLDEFLEANAQCIEEYAIKALFAKKLAKTYVNSNKPAKELWDEYEDSSLRHD